MIFTLTVAAISYLIGIGIFIHDARQHAKRANAAERERDAYARELRRRGQLHFVDGPMVVVAATSEADAINQLIRPRHGAGSGP
jgi:hypothetical protein